VTRRRLLYAGLFSLSMSGVAGIPAASAENPALNARAIITGLTFPAETRVGFEQRQLNPLFKNVSRQSGVMYRSGDQSLVMEVTAPRPERRTLQAGVVSLTRQVPNRHGPGYRTLTRQTQLDPGEPAHLALLTLEAVLGGNYQLLQSHFELQAQGTDSDWQIRLRPTDPEVRRQLSRLWLAGKARDLQLFRSERDDDSGGFSHFLEVEIRAAPAAEAG